MAETSFERESRDLRLLRRYHDHDDRQAHARLVERGLPLVRALARPYAGRGEPLEDLVQAGCVGLLGAIERFDAHARKRFVSFAAPTITGEIKRHFRDHVRPVHVPRAMQELEARISRTAPELERRLGRPATEAELAADLGVDVDEVREARAGTRASWTVPLEGDGDEDGPAQRVGAEDRGYADVERRVLVDEAARSLDDRQRRVVRLRFVDGLLQREIAELIGVSQVHVSRLLRSALVGMRAQVERDAAAKRPAEPGGDATATAASG